MVSILWHARVVGDFNCKITWDRGVVTDAQPTACHKLGDPKCEMSEMSDAEQLAHTCLASTGVADAGAERGSLAPLPSGSPLALASRRPRPCKATSRPRGARTWRQHAGLDLASAWSTRAWQVAGRASHLLNRAYIRTAFLA